MGKYYVKFLEGASAQDMAKAVVTAWADRVVNNINTMTSNYQRNTLAAAEDDKIKALMIERLGAWYKTFFGSGIPAKYLEAMSAARATYHRIRPRGVKSP